MLTVSVTSEFNLLQDFQISLWVGFSVGGPSQVLIRQTVVDRTDFAI